MDAKIGIIGAGNMGGAFFSGLLKHYSHEQIHICDRNQEKLKETITQNCCTNVNEMIDKVEVLIIAVKPQSFDELIGTLEKSIKDKLIISLMAGVTLAKLKEKTGAERVVRAMPNLPVKYEKGLTGWIKSGGVTADDEVIVKIILDSVGKQIEVTEEEQIDKITTLSGSGPAYFFYLTNLIEEKAIEYGFDPEDAQMIAEETFLGSAKIFQHEHLRAQDMISKVASKGGTTEKVLTHLEENGFNKIFKDALEAAKNRSKELNN